jgi:hypothetical protein
MSCWTHCRSRAGGSGLSLVSGMWELPSMRRISVVARRVSVKPQCFSAGKSFRYTRQCRSSPTPAAPSQTLPLRPSGVIKLIGLRLSCWARTCSRTVFAGFVFKGLEPGNPRTRPSPRLAHFEQYFWRLPDPLKANCAPHERHFFLTRASPRGRCQLADHRQVSRLFCLPDATRGRQNLFGEGVCQVREPLKIPFAPQRRFYARTLY